MRDNLLRKEIPLKQGLRPPLFRCKQLKPSPKGNSTKTRIKTFSDSCSIIRVHGSPKGNSTKTRIKTFSVFPVNDHTKQTPKGNSTKTRIKTFAFLKLIVFALTPSERKFH